MAGFLGSLGGMGGAAGGVGTGAAAGGALQSLMGGGQASASSPTGSQTPQSFQQFQAAKAPQVGPVVNPASPGEVVGNSMYPTDIQQATARPVAQQPSTMDLINKYINSPESQRLQQQNQQQIRDREAMMYRQ